MLCLCLLLYKGPTRTKQQTWASLLTNVVHETYSRYNCSKWLNISRAMVTFINFVIFDHWAEGNATLDLRNQHSVHLLYRLDQLDAFSTGDFGRAIQCLIEIFFPSQSSTFVVHTSWTMLLRLLLVANVGWLALVAGQNEIPTVPCYGPDCLVTEPTTERSKE